MESTPGRRMRPRALRPRGVRRRRRRSDRPLAAIHGRWPDPL